jgi:hypothetical protein
MSDELPAFSPGAADLLRELVQRGLPAHSLPAAARLVIALDSGLRPGTSSTSASATEPDHGADELARLLDEAGGL